MNMRHEFAPLDESFDAPAVDGVTREAEQGLLGAILMDDRLYDVVADLVQPKHFASEIHGAILGAIASLANAGKPADVVSVFERLQGRADVMYLNELAQHSLPSERRTRHYAEIVVERARSRQLATVVMEARDLAADNSLAVAERVEKVSAKLANLLDDAPGEDWVDAGTSMDEFMREIDRRATGEGEQFMPTGLAALDEQLDGGLRPGELVIIGARPSMGKTALATTIGMHAARIGQPTAMFSLEMARAALQERQVAMVSEVALGKIKRPDRMHQADWDAMTRGVEAIKRLPFFVSDRSTLNINTLRTKARALKRKRGLRLLIVDYLGLMEGTNPKDNRTTQLGEVTRNLKKLAKELGITVLLLAQLNREVEKRVDQTPVLSDLRDCGEIEQDADIVLFPHRPIHLKPGLGEAWRYYATLRVAKQRAGATGDLNLRYVGHLVRFENWHGEKPSATSTATHGSDDHFE